MITEDVLDNILRDLDSARERKRQLQLVKASAELETLQREAVAYCDGVYDAIHEVRRKMAEEETCTKD